jgi:hypothetical protein
MRWLADSAIRLLPREGQMEFELHAPSMLVVVVSLILAVLALICYFVITPATIGIAFWIAIMAYVVAALGTVVKTS